MNFTITVALPVFKLTCYFMEYLCLLILHFVSYLSFGESDDFLLTQFFYCILMISLHNTSQLLKKKCFLLKLANVSIFLWKLWPLMYDSINTYSSLIHYPSYHSLLVILDNEEHFQIWLDPHRIAIIFLSANVTSLETI